MKEDTSVFAFDHAKFSTVGSHKQSAVKRNVSKSYSLQNEFQSSCNSNAGLEIGHFEKNSKLKKNTQ